MEQTNNVALNLLQTVASQTQLPKTGRSDGDSDFQKLMDKAAAGTGKDTKLDDQPQADKPGAVTSKKDAPAQEGAEEDPIEMSKKFQVYLMPVSPEQLAQYPASWLPQDLQEGEPVVCIGVRAGENGEDIPILVGANTAEKMYGKPVVDPALYDVSDPKADAMLEATAPGADNSPAAMLEKLTADQFGKEIEQVAGEVQPQTQQEGDAELEIVDAEQAPQQLFHDVKAAPVKVGEVYDAQQGEQADVAKQIDMGLAQALEKGESMVRIQLTPENLGSVTVEISRSTEGIIRVALSAHSGETRDLLERHAGELQGLLTSRTQQSVEVDVQRQQESQQSQQQNYDGHNGHAQDGQERRRQHRDHADSQDFMQQLRLGLIPADGDEA